MISFLSRPASLRLNKLANLVVAAFLLCNVGLSTTSLAETPGVPFYSDIADASSAPSNESVIFSESLTILPPPPAQKSETLLPSWARGVEDRVSIGLVAGQEFRFFSKKPVNPDIEDGPTYVDSDFHSNGLVAVSAVKYSWKDYLKLFAGYGMATKSGEPYHQIVCAGVEYTDFVGFTLAVGSELGEGFTGLGQREKLLIMAGVAFTPFEFNLTD